MLLVFVHILILAIRKSFPGTVPQICGARRFSSHIAVPASAKSVQMCSKTAYHRAPCGFALAKPLPRIPRPVPRVAPPLAPVPISAPPRLLATELGRDERAGVENFGVAFEEAGGFSTKEVSAVLGGG